MKKFYPLFFCFIVLTVITSQAAIVDSILAKNVATNFYNSNSGKGATILSLAFTETTPDGSPAYYVFNVNDSDGFVIVSADDNALPILAYSTTGHYDAANSAPATINWMQHYKMQISFIKANNIHSTPVNTAKWQYLETKHNKSENGILGSSLAPLLTTAWNQSPYYNALCPGGSVTGCVATAMAQVMKYWNYPAKGTGSYSYCDCTAGGFYVNYGNLSANFGNTTYNWTNMPDALTTDNKDIATLMYDCGVSVNMNYSPSESSAYLDAEVGALPTYFNYDATTIKYVVRGESDADWTNLLETELNKHHPIIYNLSGVHAWVCDGYDANNYLHMNWGWGGGGNGYYSLADTINISNGTIFWGSKEAYSAIIGIQPASTPVALDLTTFTGHVINKQSALLQWSTAREDAGDKVIIMRSADAATWTAIGQQVSLISTSNESNHSFKDNNPNTPVSYYQLKIINTDGSIKYSAIVQLNLAAQNQVTVSPNPIAGNSFTVDMGANITSPVPYGLYNSEGQIIQHGFITTRIQVINAENIPAGYYMLNLQNGQHFSLMK